MFTARELKATALIDGFERSVFEQVDLDLYAGEVVDIVGRSGSGKSTLLRALSATAPTETGELALDEIPYSRHAPQEWRSLVTLLPQKPALVGGTVLVALELPWTLRAYERRPKPSRSSFRELLDQVGLEGVSFDRAVDELSVGQQARIAFVRALAASPRVLLLDEADAALDLESSRLVTAATKRWVQSGSRAVVRVRHKDDDGISSRRLLLDHGALTEVSRCAM